MKNPPLLSTFQVHVTWADLRDGESCQPRRCALALALTRATGVEWSVGTESAFRWNDLCYFDHDGQALIGNFDLLGRLAWFSRRTITMKRQAT